jgi:hypothetical protein
VRGDDHRTRYLFSYLSQEQRVPTDHPLPAIRALTRDTHVPRVQEFVASRRAASRKCADLG